MLNGSPSRAELLSDSAVYQRTPRGQRKLIESGDWSSSPRLRLLARVNGYTDLRRLVDLAPDDARALAESVEVLLQQGLIELIEAEPADKRKHRGR
jgi:hypothetical protein